MSQIRQLAAIMFTDIVGYTLLMGKNEQKALELLRVNRDIQKSLIEAHNGKWLKEMGDGSLASFPSASEAVFCALKIQEELKNNNDLNLRIGIHVGEVIVEHGDIFGDGVNIASRLESLAPTGGVWISESVNSNIQNKQGLETRFVRDEQLKNVKEPVRVFEVRLKNTKFSKIIATSQPHKSKQHLSSKKKILYIFIVVVLSALIYFIYPIDNQPITVAVLAFDDQSPDGDHDWLGQGMAEEIINVLAQVNGLQVTAKTSSFSFADKSKTIPEIGKVLGVNTILEGSIVKIENELKITVHLIDVETDKQIWGDTFDRDYSDLSVIRNEVAQNVASNLMSTLSIDEVKNIGGETTINPEAFEYFKKGEKRHYEKYLSESGVIDDFEHAEKMFMRAISIDSTYAVAYAGLADLYDTHSDVIGSITFKRKRDSLANIAYNINPNSSYVVTTKGYRFRNLISFNLDSAFYYYKHAYKLDPNNIRTLEAAGDLLSEIGLDDAAISIFNKILLTDPLNEYVRFLLAQSLFYKGDIDKSRKNNLKILENNSNDISANFGMLVIAVFYDSDKIEATRIIEKIEKLSAKLKWTRALPLAMEGKKEEALSLNKDILVWSLLKMKEETISKLDTKSVEEYFTSPYSYLNLNNAAYFDFIREEPKFKEILIKAKEVHDIRVGKYGHLFDD